MSHNLRANLLTLALLVLITLSKGLVWMAALPPWKICDEPSHFDNIQYRSEVGEAPKDLGKDIPKVMHEGASAEMKLSWDATGRYYRNKYLDGVRTTPEEPKLADLAKKREFRTTDGQVSSIGYPGLYYWVGTYPYRVFLHSSILVRLMAVRFYSLVLGVIAVVFAFLAAQLALKNRPLAFAAAFVVAMQPMESQMTVAVNNDAGVMGLAAVIFFLQIYMLNAYPRLVSPALGLLVGVLMSCIILTKPHGYAMIPGSAFVVALMLWRHPRVRKAWLLGGLAAVPFFAFAGVRIYNLYTANVLIPAMNQEKPDPGFLTFLNTMGDEYKGWLFKSAWGQFGWLDYSIDGRWLDLVYMVWFIACCGLIVALTRWVLRSDGERLWFNERLVAFSGVTALGIVLFILYAEHRFRLVGAQGVIQGRSFLFGMPAMAIVTCAGLGTLVPARFRQLVAAGICTAAFAMNSGALVCILRHNNGD